VTADLALQLGGDLEVSSTGDIAIVNAADWTKQRVLRRLLTNPRDYIWQLTYGAGLAQYVGLPGVGAALSGVVRAQLLLEAGVSPSPVPVLGMNIGDDGVVVLSINYADAQTGQSSVLSFSL